MNPHLAMMTFKHALIQALSSAGIPGFKGWSQDPQGKFERYVTTEDFLEQHAKDYLSSPASHSLDLGCGNQPRNPFRASISKGADINQSSDDRVFRSDLGLGSIPCQDGEFDFVTAFDFIEHVQRVAIIDGRTRFPFVELMSEIHRILKPGGLFFSRTPAYPHKEAFQDPTHTNIITEDTFAKYFCGDIWAKSYGFNGCFTLVAQDWCAPSLLTLIRKV